MRILPYDAWSKDPAWYPDHVKKVRETTSSVNSFGLICSSGSLSHSACDNFCTAPMNYYNRTKTSWVVWSLYHSTLPRTYAWHKYLLDPETSPWKRVLRKENAILESGDGTNHVAVLRIDSDTMFKDVINLCIALRRGSEDMYNVDKFISTCLPKYTDLGFTFSEALACYVLERDKNKYSPTPRTFTGGHAFLSAYNPFDIKAFSTCKPYSKGPVFRSEGRYNPSDEIWNGRCGLTTFLKSGRIESRVASAMNSVFQKSRDLDIPVPDYSFETYTRTPKEMLEFIRS